MKSHPNGHRIPGPADCPCRPQDDGTPARADSGRAGAHPAPRCTGRTREQDVAEARARLERAGYLVD